MQKALVTAVERLLRTFLPRNRAFRSALQKAPCTFRNIDNALDWSLQYQFLPPSSATSGRSGASQVERSLAQCIHASADQLILNLNVMLCRCTHDARQATLCTSGFRQDGQILSQGSFSKSSAGAICSHRRDNRTPVALCTSHAIRR